MNRIKKLRNSKGITQIELCHRLGIKQSTLNKWENYEHEPSVHYLRKLSDIFSVSIDNILCNFPQGDIKDKDTITIISQTFALSIIDMVEDFIEFNEINLDDWLQKGYEHITIRIKRNNRSFDNDTITLIIKDKPTIDFSEYEILGKQISIF